MSALHEVQVQYIDGWPYPDSDTLIWELEHGARVVGSLALPRIDEQLPDMPDRLQAFLWAYQWGAVNRLTAHRTEDERELQLISPWQSAVQVEDYQLYPVLKSLLMPRISLLLADDVGLGKTIEAGLILSELFARRRIRRVLIICPASLQLQWRDEMREKFHLDFTIVDRDETFRLQRELGVDSNPWASYPRIVTSIDYLRQRDVLESFEAATRNLSGRSEAILPWQMLIVDEVHNLAPSTYGDNSERCEMLRHIAPSFEHRLFLSATPHNGYTISFSGLLELLDPVRFQQKAFLNEDDHKQIGLAMIRRLKKELSQEGEPGRFADRKVEALSVSIQGDEKALFDALRAYREGLQRVLERVNNRERHLGGFLIKLLTKRLLSSSYAFARTWWRHVEGLDIEESDDEVMEVTHHAISRAEMVMNDDQERALREEDAMRQTGSWLRRRQYADQLKWQRAEVNACLTRLGWSEEAMKKPLHELSMPSDARWETLSHWIDTHLMRNGSLVDNERLILFTEYKHTLDYIIERLRRRRLTTPQVESLYGGATSQQRERIKNAFNDPRDPLRILVGTDTVSEGISLQLTCRYVVHQEIPWNPMRLEQRNGRVDRHGQERDVFIFHFTSSDEADMQFMETVVKKVEQARTDLGSVGQVIDSTLEEHFTQHSLSVEELERRVSLAEQDRQEAIDMRGLDTGDYAECVRAMHRLDATQHALDLSSAHTAELLRQAVIYEHGRLREEHDQVATFYRFEKIPPTWKKLVQETLERQDNRVASLPKLVFDPTYFEVLHNGRRIYKPRTDAVLVRLGHPLMQRALSVLRRQMWEETATSMARWTVEQCTLEPRMNAVLLLYLLVEATNQFREVAHQEVIIRPFEVRGNGLFLMDPELWPHIERQPRQPLQKPELAQETDRLRDWWPSHQEQVRQHIYQERVQWRSDLEQRMQQRLQDELRTEKVSFDSRLRELANLRNPQNLQYMQREAERQRQHLLQGVLPLEELQQERFQREQQLQDLEWQIEHSYLDTMKHMVERERERVLTQVLPQRYTLATVDVQPLAIRYMVNPGSR